VPAQGRLGVVALRNFKDPSRAIRGQALAASTVFSGTELDGVTTRLSLNAAISAAP
jgi:hypothetical protein